MKFLVTGGAGFIGSAFVRLLLASSRPQAERPSLVVNFDKLTYAGNLENLAPVANDARYRFVHGDICDAALVNQLRSNKLLEQRLQLDIGEIADSPNQRVSEFTSECRSGLYHSA